jgi:ferritin
VSNEKGNIQRQLKAAEAAERHQTRELNKLIKQRYKAKDRNTKAILGAAIDETHSKLNEARTLVTSCKARLDEIKREGNGRGRR